MQYQATLSISILLSRKETLYLDLHACLQFVCDALKVLTAHDCLNLAVNVSGQICIKTLASVFQLYHTMWDTCGAFKASDP